MTLDSLLQQHRERSSQLERVRKEVEEDEKSLAKLKESIDHTVEEEFGRYIMSFNEKLAENQRITKWSANYVSHLNRIRIAITEINGKRVRDHTKSEQEELPLPNEFKEIENFGNNYPISLEFYVHNDIEIFE